MLGPRAGPRDRNRERRGPRISDFDAGCVADGVARRLFTALWRGLHPDRSSRRVSGGRSGIELLPGRSCSIACRHRAGPPGPGFGPRGGPPSEPAFLTPTREAADLLDRGCACPSMQAELVKRGVPAVLLLRANSIWNSQLFFDWRSLLWLAATLAAVALLCWWPFVHRVTRSIRQMDRATEEIAQGRFDNHVTLRRSDELGHLGQQINRMAGRLEGFVKHQKRFLRRASPMSSSASDRAHSVRAGDSRAESRRRAADARRRAAGRNPGDVGSGE